ncbi:MAG: PAS domain-containing sensor histidine kinase [Rhodospirillaceae bacterium]
MDLMLGWLGAEGLTPHGFCLTWNPTLVMTHAVANAAMGASYIACGAVIYWFGRRRPDMGPKPLFLSLSIVFALCGLTHFSDIATIWFAVYEVQAVLKASAAIASVITVSVLAVLAPRALDIPSVAQLQNTNEQLQRETTQHQLTAARLARLASVVEQNPNIIIITDGEGMIEYVNGAFETMTGYKRADAIGRKPSMLAAGTTPQWVYDNLWHSVRGQQEWRGELQDRRADGTEFWVASSIAPLCDDEGAVNGFVAIQEDITDRKAAEDEMRVAKRQAEIANKAKSEMLANMSHELRTPLNAIIGFSEVIMLEVFGPVGEPKYKRYVADINSSACHLLDIINDVLDVSAIEAGKLTLFEERVELMPIIEAALRLVAPRAEKQEVSLDVVAGPPIDVVVDQRRLKQVLINLLSNAIKFSSPGGSIRVSAQLESDRTLKMIVADSGIGMDSDELDVALQPFGQVDGSLQRRHEGTGLGLPICIGIMERHGGALWLDSAKGKGTTVYAVLPAVRVFPAGAPEAVE